MRQACPSRIHIDSSPVYSNFYPCACRYILYYRLYQFALLTDPVFPGISPGMSLKKYFQICQLPEVPSFKEKG